MSEKISIVPVSFRESGNGIVPVDPCIYSAVMQYCEANLCEQPDLTRLARTWAAIEFGAQEEIIKVHGLTAFMMRPDIPIFRVTGQFSDRVTKQLYDRLNSHFSDGGWRGHDVFLYINEKESPNQRCENWEQSLALASAVPAQRFAVRIK